MCPIEILCSSACCTKMQQNISLLQSKTTKSAKKAWFPFTKHFCLEPKIPDSDFGHIQYAMSSHILAILVHPAEMQNETIFQTHDEMTHCDLT